MGKQVRVIRPVVVTQTFETASWYRRIELKPGIYPMRDVSFATTKRLAADIPGTVTGSAFPSSFCGNPVGDGNQDKDVGKAAVWPEYWNLDPRGFWDRDTERHGGAVVIEDAPAPALTCGECGETRAASEFCDPSASEPHCKECAAGFWEMMGDDPCGKGWR